MDVQESFDGHCQSAVDWAHKSNVSQWEQIREQVIPVNCRVHLIEFGEGEEQDWAGNIELKRKIRVYFVSKFSPLLTELEHSLFLVLEILHWLACIPIF